MTDLQPSIVACRDRVIFQRVFILLDYAGNAMGHVGRDWMKPRILSTVEIESKGLGRRRVKMTTRGTTRLGGVSPIFLWLKLVRGSPVAAEAFVG